MGELLGYLDSCGIKVFRDHFGVKGTALCPNEEIEYYEIGTFKSNETYRL